MAFPIKFISVLLVSTVSIGALFHFGFLHTQEPETEPRKPHEPYLIQLRRESVPVRRKGEVVSHKTSYSGVLSLGLGDQRPQEFRVVFDTGSGHVVVPSAGCSSESCVLHRRYNMLDSPSAVPINVDGSEVAKGESCDQVKIGFGTGSVTGEFVRDKVCLGSASAGGAQWRDTICGEVNVVMAVEMSTTPFKNFGFDGILGLGLDALALNPDFSFFNVLTKNKLVDSPHFGVFLVEGDSGENSEIAIGGHNPAKTQHPLSWTPVAKPELGYWQVQIKAFRIDGVEMDFCKDGSCHGVMDTGTSHLGVPAPHDKMIAELLTRDADDLSDCRQVRAPVVQIEVPGFNITLDPENYMRPLPLKAGINVGSSAGVRVPSPQAQAPLTTTMPPSLVREDGKQVERYCRPRLMPVNLPAPVGPHLFILGEPVLQRYYTVFDWKGPSIGFALSTSKRNMRHKEKEPDQGDDEPEIADGIILFQVEISYNTRPKLTRAARPQLA